MHDWQQYVRERLPRLTVGPERESEIVAELALQLDQAYSGALAAGAPDEDALRQARSQVRNWEDLAREINRAEHYVAPPPERRSLSGATADIRYALRFFRRNPTFAAIAVLTLAVGIGGNTAIFTLVDAVALRSLPYRDPGRLMAIETHKVRQPEIEPWTSALDFFDLRDHNQSFSAVAGISPIWNVVLTGRGPAERLETLYVSADFFPMLGVGTALGRTFNSEEDNRTKPAPVVVLSHRFWQRHFGGSRQAIGSTLVLDGGAFSVIGILPAGFRYAGEPVAGTASDIEVWLPLAANPLTASARGLRFLKVAGRLKAGVSAERARAEVAALGAALAEQFVPTNQGFAFDIQPLSQQVKGRFRVAMLLLLGTVGFVLLMACASVANLLLARAAARHREIAVRVALGASRFRLLRQLLTEGLVLAAMGGIAGLGLAYAGLTYMIRIGPEALVRAFPIQIDSRALIFTTWAVLFSAVLAGLPPAWRMLRGDVNGALRESGRGLTADSHRLRSAMVVVQVSVALALLVGAGLLVRSFQRLLDVDPGFQPRNLVTISTLIYEAAGTPQQRTALWRQFHDRLMGVPGVTGVAAVSRLPLMGSNLGSWLYREGNIAPGRPGLDVEYRVATPGYFGVMGIPLRAGRLFDDHDDANAASFVLVNEAAARRVWPAEDAVGKRIKLGPNPANSPWLTVLGVVGNVRHMSLDTEPLPEVYRPYAASPLVAPILVIRTSTDPEPLRGALSATVRSVNPGVSAYNVFTMQELVDRSTAQRRFVMLLVGAFAVVALLLAAIGIYGTVSQAVTRRTAEIGLRMALGASPAAALSLVFRDGLRLTMVGIAAGALAAMALTQFMAKMLFEVRPLDPVAFGAAALALGAFALLACYIPARRATRVDPLTAMRQDT
jgi:putative ABC transport system permease protein